MNSNYKKHLFHQSKTIREALPILDKLASSAILFVVDDNDFLIGSLTDGDIRRGLINGIGVDENVIKIIQNEPKYISKSNFNIEDIIRYKANNFKVIPLVDEQKKVINVINFLNGESYLPIDAVIMAGGRGQRLKPLTDNVPKPLLEIGGKPIIEHNINNLIKYGINDFQISLLYLGEQIEAYFGDGSQKSVSINYIWENEPLGTAGALKQVKEYKHDEILLTNSDLLTNLDYEKFYLEFKKTNADLIILSIPYKVDVPYAILEIENDQVVNFKEKPTYRYLSNGGVYLMKKNLLDLIPENAFFDATDLIESAIKNKMKVVTYNFNGYWLDVGKHDDFKKAQEDIKNIKF